MSILTSSRSARVALMASACLLSLGLLFLAPHLVRVAGAWEVAATPAAAHHPHAGEDTGTPGGGHTQEVGTHPAVPAEEAETGDGRPAKAWLLTALLFPIFPGAILGLLFGGRVCRRKTASLLVGRRLASPISLLARLEPAPSRLSVFLL